MASLASPSPPRRTHPSASDSSNSTPHEVKVESATTNNGGSLSDGKKPDLAEDLDHLDSTECIERLTRYDVEYKRRLIAKYFSGKTIYGGNIFYVETTIGDEILKSSRLPCFRLYEDPIVGFEDECSNGSTPAAEAHANLSNGKHFVKK